MLTLTTVQRRTFIVLLGLASTLGAFTVDLMMPSFSAIGPALHATGEQMQLSIMAITIGYAVGLLVVGPASDQFGRRKPLLAGLAMHALATMLLATSSTFELFISMRFVQGFAASAASVLALAIIRDLYVGAEMLRFLAPMNAVMALGPIGAPLLGSQLLAVLDWRQILWVLVAIGVAMFVANFFFLTETLAEENRRSAEGARAAISRFAHVLADRSYVGVAIVSVMVSVALFGYLNQAPFLFGTSWGLSHQQFGFAYAGGSVFAMTGMQIGSRIARKFGAARVLLLTLSIGAASGLACVAVGSSMQPVWLQLVALYLWTLCFGISVPPSQTLLLASHGQEAGTAASLSGVLSNLITSLAAPVYAQVSNTSVLGVGQVVLGAMVIAILALIFIARPKYAKNEG